MAEETTKVTLFLYDEDIELMKRRFGYGWSARIREVLHQWLKDRQQIQTLHRLRQIQTTTPDFPEE